MSGEHLQDHWSSGLNIEEFYGNIIQKETMSLALSVRLFRRTPLSGREKHSSVLLMPSMMPLGTKSSRQRYVPFCMHEMSHLMRLWYFSSSVNSFFKRACAAIQWGLMSDFWLDPSSTSILYVCEQRRLWQDWADA